MIIRGGKLGCINVIRILTESTLFQSRCCRKHCTELWIRWLPSTRTNGSTLPHLLQHKTVLFVQIFYPVKNLQQPMPVQQEQPLTTQQQTQQMNGDGAVSETTAVVHVQTQKHHLHQPILRSRSSGSRSLYLTWRMLLQAIATTAATFTIQPTSTPEPTGHVLVIQKIEG